MPTKIQILRMGFAGGWATDFGPTAEVGISEAGTVAIPFLQDAENLTYLIDGGVQKMGGVHKLNSSQLESGAEVTGLYDCWLDDGDGTWSQHRICHVSTKVYKDDADGTFTQIDSGLTDNAIPNYATMDNLLIYSSDLDQTTPKKWDGTTLSALTTDSNKPTGWAFAEVHKNRLWVAGDDSNPSRLYYSAHSDDGGPGGATGWTPSNGSGFISIDPQDGDRITAIASHKNELWVFKGPNKGSIHRVVGSAPTGSDGFALSPFTSGVGAVNQNTLFRFRDDLGFMAPDGTVHSLNATASFGDFNDAALSRPIHSWLTSQIDFTNLKKSWSAALGRDGYVLFGMPTHTATNGFPNVFLLMDFRFSVQSPESSPGHNTVRWAQWNSFTGASLAVVNDASASNRPIIMVGGEDGYIRKTGQPVRSIESTSDTAGSGTTAISFKATTPKMHYGTPFLLKTLTHAAVGIAPKGNYNLTFAWQRDDESQQSTTIAQSGGSLIGATEGESGAFVMDTDVIGGTSFIDKFVDLTTGGEFRSIEFEISQTALDEEAELHTISGAIESPTNLSVEA